MADPTPGVDNLLADQHWRIREMASKVVAKREIGAAADAEAALASDPVPRVRRPSARYDRGA